MEMGVEGGRMKFSVRGERFNGNLRGQLFGYLEEVVEAGTITTFKRHWDRYVDRKALEGYRPNVGR